MVEFRLLGAVDIKLADARSPQSVLTRPKDLALLVYLALATPRGFQRRDTLLALFWPESDGARARGALNQCLYRLRQSLGEGLVLTRGAEEVGLDWTRWWCDAVELRAASAARRYADVLQLYRGELLGGFHADASPEFDQWLDAERSAVRETAGTAALQLAAGAEATGDGAAAVGWLRQALAVKPYEESTLQRLLELLHRTGDGRTALAEYQRFSARLAADLEAQPSPSTAAIATRIRAEMVSADAVGLYSPADAPAPIRPPRRPKLVAAMTAAVLLTASGTYVISDIVSDVPDASRQIVIADFVNRTAEEHLGAAVTEALNVDLSQSAVIRPVSGSQVGAVLKRMGRDTATLLGDELAREVAVREGLRAVLRGQIATVGSGYVLTAQLITADSGRILLSVREEAAGPDEVVAAVDRLSERLRKQMGESVRRARTHQPLEAVTTSSLEALKLYSAGVRAVRYSDTGDGGASGGLPGRIRPDERAVALFERAIALDSTFASAHRALGVQLYWLGDQRTRVNQLLTRAYELRQRLTERERLLTEGTYFHFVRAEHDRAIASFEAMLDRDAKDVAAIQHLGWLYFRRQDFDRAASMWEREWALRGGAPAIVYTSALLGAGRLARADSILQHFAQLDSTGGLWLAELIRVRAGLGDFIAVDTLLRRLEAVAARGGPQTRSQATRHAALWKIWRGYYGEGVAQLFGPEKSPTDIWGVLTLARLEVYVLRDPNAARRRIDAQLARTPLTRTADPPYVFLASVYAHAGDYDRAMESAQLLKEPLRWPWVGRNPDAAALYTPRALARAAVGDIRQAREIMSSAEREIGCWYGTHWSHLTRARAEEMAGHPDSVIVALERLVAVPSCKLTLTWSDLWGPVTQAYGHERLAQLYDARGDTQRALLHYGKFVELWPDPDPLLRPRWLAAKDRIAVLSKLLRDESK